MEQTRTSQVYNNIQTTPMIPTFDKTSASFTQSLNGFSEAQSANTLRNSVSPISFPKAKRFNEMTNAGAGITFYNISGQYNQKKGTSFGYGNKVTGVRRSNSPGPGMYESSISNSPQRVTKYNNGKFGVGYDRFHLTCDIDKGVKIYDNRDKPSPNSYKPDKQIGTQGVPIYSIAKKLPGRMQSLEKKSFLPSPFHYTVKTESVLPTNYK